MYSPFFIPDKTGINCFTGLAWINSASSHLPKTRKDEATKRLFQQLFEAQYKFERCTDSSDPQVAMIISMIDQLLEMILHYSYE